MSITDTVALLWPALFFLFNSIIFLLLSTQLKYNQNRQYLGVIIILGVLSVVYIYPSVLTPMRWGLTLVGFAAPVALSIVGIRYLVEET